MVETRVSPWPRLGWGLFLLLILSATVVVFGAPLGLSFLIAVIVAVLAAWRYPSVIFYFWVGTASLLGLLVSIPTGALQFGERAFGGSIDVTLGELAAGTLLAAWALRVLLWRTGRSTHEWKPWLPLLGAYLLLLAAHLLSIFSPVSPDPLLVFKYSLRPVFLVYLICVILPANFIRTRRQLMVTLGVLASVGLLFALDGFRSLFVFGAEEAGLHRARPLPIFGYASPLGGNHNALAEVLLLSAPLALAMASLIHSPRMRRLAYGAAVFMVFITLLTFARSAWLALACEVILLSLTSWKVWLREHRKQVLTFLVIAFVPLAVYMTIFSLRAGVQSSTDARAMVTEVSTNLFLGSPWLGVGAGTFLDRLSHVYAYTVEFGSPIESHGVLQKILAETGLVGLAAFLWVMWVITRTILATWRKLERRNSEARVYLLLVAALLGAFVYQLFDTTYWTPRLWLPVGLVLVAGRLFTREPSVDGPNFLNIA